MATEQRLHFDYEDKEVKLNFSFPIEDTEKCVDQMRRFKKLLETGVAEIIQKIKDKESELNGGRGPL